ncbi:MAG: tetratricopeptide repeat protein [Bacteroidota bacterium]|nr:tetratricopeptide repeat protein [Bacteroidota bacterium]
MKTKAIFIWMMLFLAGTLVVAQEDSKFGEEPAKCHAQLSTYDQFYKQGSFADAYPAWSWCFKHCPKSTKNIYIQGPNILDKMIEKSKGDTKEAYIDTLLIIYDKRTTHFGDKGKNLGRKAIAIMTYRQSKAMKAYKLFEEAVKTDGIETSSTTLGRYFQLATVLVQNDLITTKELIKLYTEISQIFEQKISAGDPGAEKAKEQVDRMLINTGELGCGMLEDVFRPIYEKNLDNRTMLGTIQTIMEKQECFDFKLFAEVSEKMYAMEKTASAAHSLAQYFFKNNNAEKAESYYKEAIEMQEDESKKADLYFELGLLYFNQMDQYQTARSYAKKAIGADSEHGKSHKLLAQIYASVASDCGENKFEHLTVYWVVVDKLLKAKSVSPELADEVNPMISKYSQYFPTKKDAFFYEVMEGESYTVNCWINETTTARFNE